MFRIWFLLLLFVIKIALPLTKIPPKEYWLIILSPSSIISYDMTFKYNIGLDSLFFYLKNYL